ncbi:hypothetical protein [Flavobacterium lipolyticum]|uniref:Uncharacterized protein n=1 Tax=Flavobacterium lipolyticum TaxID=2893754 RepID=A0ABS8M470_9FLAO|nr:hypothetical protein [Flavobacterium sp. F-126]MCC9019615.1 hypothetical protein [Flavobacterium sp. F-126]
MKKLLLMPVFFTLVLFYSCNHDENVNTEKVSENKNEDHLKTIAVTESVAFLKDFQQQQSTQKNANFNLTIDFKSIQQIDITDTDAKLTVVKAETGLDNVDSSILQIRINGELQTVLFNLIPEEGFNNKKTGKVIDRYDEFSGAVVISDLKGIIKNNFVYKSGNLLGEVKSPGPDPIPLNNVNVYPKPKPSDISLPYIMPGYQFRGEGSPTNYASMGVAFATYYTTAMVNEIEKRITDKNLTPCQKAVLEKLKTNKNVDIARMLARLGANSPYTLNITTADFDEPATIRYTQKSPISRFDYTMIISSNYTDRTSLSLAGNILHEVVHAYFLSLQDQVAAQGSSVALTEFPALFEVYVQQKAPTGAWMTPNLQHKQMAETYVNAIAAALQEFQTGNTAATSIQQKYLDLAWGGLYKTSVFDKTFPEGSADRSRILNRLHCEQQGADAQNHGGERQYPIGSKCEDYIKSK